MGPGRLHRVDLFFVLSGFLVGGLLFDEAIATGKIDWVRFLIQRAFRIYPSFYFFQVVATLTRSEALRAKVYS